MALYPLLGEPRGPQEVASRVVLIFVSRTRELLSLRVRAGTVTSPQEVEAYHVIGQKEWKEYFSLIENGIVYYAV